MTEAVCRCNGCQRLFRDDQPGHTSLRYSNIPENIAPLEGDCPNCKTDEFITCVEVDDVITAKDLKEAVEIAKVTHPGFLPLKGTRYGILRHYIFVK